MTGGEAYAYITRIIVFLNRRYAISFFITPRDFDVLWGWWEKQIPFPVIRDALVRVVERWNKKDRRVYSFANFNYQVKKEFARFADLKLGRHVREIGSARENDSPDSGELARFLDRCPDELRPLKPDLEGIKQAIDSGCLTRRTVRDFYARLVSHFEQDDELILQTRRFLKRISGRLDHREMEKQFKINFLLNRLGVPFLEDFEN